MRPRRSGAELENFRTRVMRLTCTSGISGLPQMNIPAGTIDGCPIGLSFIGWTGGDEALLKKRRAKWQKKHQETLNQILAMQKQLAQDGADKAKLEEELAGLRKIVQVDDPLPTLMSLRKTKMISTSLTCCA